jgi:simple sugar transport system permease protein
MAVALPRPVEVDPAMEVASQEHVITTAGRTIGIGVFLILVGLLCAFVFGRGSGAHATASFVFDYRPNNRPRTAFHVPGFTVTTQPWCIGLGILCGVMGIALLLRPKIRYGVSLGLLSVGVVATLFAFLMWAQHSTPGLPMNLTGLVAIGVGSAAILILGSLAGTIGERSGVVNIAIEGQFLLGAFVSVVVASAVLNNVGGSSGQYWVGGLAGIASGMLIGILLGWLSQRFGANQIIVGIVLVALVTGLTDYLNLQIFFHYPQLNIGNVAPYVFIPVLDKIPFVGPILFQQNLYIYAAMLLVIGLSIALFRTQWGLRVRAVGEHPRAAETVGIDVVRTRYKAVLLGGAIGGLGGAFYSLGLSGAFSPEGTAGIGYIALATMIVGSWRPYRCLAAALLFGVAGELSTYVGTYNLGSLNPEWLVMLPYLAVILVVAGLVGKVRPPAADGINYSRE